MRMAMIAITTRSSIRVNALRRLEMLPIGSSRDKSGKEELTSERKMRILTFN
jgi:hypothetical protein